MINKTAARRRGLAKLLVGRCALAFFTLLAALGPISGPPPAAAEDSSWVSTWMASPQSIWPQAFPFPTKIPPSVHNQTIRQIVRISLGGSQVRVVFSNAYGEDPLTIGAASIALAGTDSEIVSGSRRTLTFGGDTSIVVRPGAPAVSDPVDLAPDDRARLTVSLFLPNQTQLTTFHWDGRQTAYIADGDRTDAARLSDAATTDARIILSEVLVQTQNDGAVVALGDSITDGNGATIDADSRWPDYLAKRLVSRDVTVLNAGISGARLLRDRMGVNAAARFERDVLAKPNVRAVILLIGINDIAWPGTPLETLSELPEAESLKSAYNQLIALAKSHNVRVIGATMPPFRGALSDTPFDSYYQPAKDALRQTLNDWIRTTADFDAIVDFDAVLRDPENPGRLAPRFDSGDHLHPGDAGNQAMADAIGLETLLGN